MLVSLRQIPRCWSWCLLFAALPGCDEDRPRRGSVRVPSAAEDKFIGGYQPQKSPSAPRVGAQTNATQTSTRHISTVACGFIQNVGDRKDEWRVSTCVVATVKREGGGVMLP